MRGFQLFYGPALISVLIINTLHKILKEAFALQAVRQI